MQYVSDGKMYMEDKNEEKTQLTTSMIYIITFQYDVDRIWQHVHQSISTTNVDLQHK